MGDAAATPDFSTVRLPADPDALAPDGSDVRLLLALPGQGSLAHFELPEGSTSAAVRHRTVQEIWFFLAGRGEMWRRNAVREETVRVGPGDCVTVPLGTTFQFRSLGPGPLQVIGATMPPWPGAEEAVLEDGPWAPSAGKGGG
jgi:mannose-6-phosphate isomerase-like protein (cupin superfamily)